MKYQRRAIPIFLLIFLLLTSISTLRARQTSPLILPFQWFEPNQGQINSQFAYIARDRGYTVFMGPTEVAYSLTEPSTEVSRTQGPMTFVNVHMQLMGANANPTISGENLLPGVSNYIKGKSSFTDIPHYAGVRYHNLYNGIDMTYYGSTNGLQYDFLVAPNANPRQIRLHFSDVERLEVAANGDLLIHAANNSLLTHKVPYSYQNVNGLRQEIHSRYVLLNDQTVGFDAGNYDKSQALVIDPPVVYSTYIGGTLGSDVSGGIAVDAFGNTYIGGQAEGDFPITPGSVDGTYGGYYDGFVTKFSSDGSTLIYSTYLGGMGSDYVSAIAVDNIGNAYVTGLTYSTDFPVTASAFQKGADLSVFVTKLNAAGNHLLYSTRLGGEPRQEQSNDIAVDNAGNAYVTGYTQSANFPTRNAAQTYAGDGDIFVTRLDTNASGAASLIYSTYIGGSGGVYTFPDETGNAIAVDAAGNAYVTGETYAPNFPTTVGAYDNSLGGGRDTFVVRLDTNAAGPSSVIYSTLLGGETGGTDAIHRGAETSYGITVDTNGSAYITGMTYSPDFPVTAGVFDTTFNGTLASFDAYVAKIDTNASGDASLVYSTFLGGNYEDIGMDVELAKNGVYVVGRTFSEDFPTLDPAQSQLKNVDAFITGLNADGSALTYSTFWGGSSVEQASALAIDSADNLYITGYTFSNDYPTTNGAFDKTQGYSDGFVLKMGSPSSPMNAAPSRNYFTISNPTLTWNPVSRVAQYIIQVSKSRTFSLPLAYTKTVPATQLEVTTEPLTEGTYYWRVSANDGVTWSAVDSFTIDLP